MLWFYDAKLLILYVTHFLHILNDLFFLQKRLSYLTKYFCFYVMLSYDK